jgi:serine/threonine protein kinase
VGGYRLLGILGEGGQGTAFLGVGTDGRKVAVKLLHAHLINDDDARQRFLREVQIATRVARFCTAQVLATGSEEDRPYIVSEYVPGITLEESVRQHGPRTGASLERLAVSTATALAAIHGAGVLHRDFKPANVILGPDGPVVIDFGIARALDAGLHPTQTMELMGTPAYLAPEQISHLETGPAADIFAWASTLAFAANGGPPFHGATWQEIFRRVVHDRPDLGSLSEPLRSIISGCLEKNPDARPSAEELLRSLTQSSGPLVAGAAQAGSGDSRGTGRSSAIGASSLGASSASSSPTLGVGKAARDRRRHRNMLISAAAAVTVIAVAATALVLNGGHGSRLRNTAAGLPLSATTSSGSQPSGSPSATTQAKRGSVHRQTASTAAATSGSSTTAASRVTPPASPTAASTAGSTPVPTGPNLAGNGSFETGSLSPWTDTSHSALTTAVAESGKYAVQMSAPGGSGGAGVAQVIDVTPGTTYLLSGWIMSGSTGGITYLGVKKYDSNVYGTSRTTTNETWTKVSMYFTAAPGYHTADIWCWRHVLGAAYCDNVSVRKMS